VSEANNKGWDAHWRHASNDSACDNAGIAGPALAEHWSLQLSAFAKAGKLGRVLDIGCGSGVLSLRIQQSAAAAQSEASLYGIDISLSALQQYRNRIAAGITCCTDGRRLPFLHGSFDLVVSQFGVEYGGRDALHAAADMVASGGKLALACHIAGGALQLECERNLRAIETISKSSLLRAASTVFNWSGPRAGTAPGDPGFREADHALASAVRITEDILRVYGREVAGGTIWRLYSDLAHMYPKLAQYDAMDLQQWCSQMESETLLYAERLRLMISAAVDAETRDSYLSYLASSGFMINQNLLKATDSASLPFAWILVAERNSI